MCCDDCLIVCEIILIIRNKRFISATLFFPTRLSRRRIINTGPRHVWMVCPLMTKFFSEKHFFLFRSWFFVLLETLSLHALWMTAQLSLNDNTERSEKYTLLRRRRRRRPLAAGCSNGWTSSRSFSPDETTKLSESWCKHFVNQMQVVHACHRSRDNHPVLKEERIDGDPARYSNATEHCTTSRNKVVWWQQTAIIGISCFYGTYQ